MNVYDEKGPPMAGGDALRVALVGWLGAADSMTGALQPSHNFVSNRQRNPHPRAAGAQHT